MLDYGFATLDDLKSLLGITDTDASRDSLLQAILDRTAGMIESCTGRNLRRDHARVELFPGGNRCLIRLGMTHVVKVHSVRESETGDFETAANYEELVEGTDFVVDASASGGGGMQAGEGGVLRRLGQDWLAVSDGRPTVKVVYTAGFKTDGELAIENATLEITHASVSTFELQVEKDAASTAFNDCYLSPDSPTVFSTSEGTSSHTRGIVRFDTLNRLLPTWQIGPFGLTLTLTAYSSAPFSPCTTKLAILVLDPATLLPNDLAAYIYATTVFLQDGGLFSVSTTTPAVLANAKLYTDAEVAATLSAIRTGHISFAVVPSFEKNLFFYSQSEPTLGYRPSLSIRHRPAFRDVLFVPDDLRNANLLQAVSEYQSRVRPGLTAEAMRGVSIASGASLMKPLADLLPEVERVAMRYRRLY